MTSVPKTAKEGFSCFSCKAGMLHIFHVKYSVNPITRRITRPYHKENDERKET